MDGFYCSGLHRMIYNRHRRYLAVGDPIRTDPSYGCEELDDSPLARTHAESVAAGKEADEYEGPANKHPRHRTSIKWWCPLSILPFFDVVKDFVPDFMHIVKDFFSLHYIPLFKGLRVPSAMKNKRPVLKRVKGKLTTEMRAAHRRKLQRWKDGVARHEVATEV
jgi:hypothetical protein